MNTDRRERPQGRALVTGATSGLGRSVAHALSEQGWAVLVHGRDAQRCDEVAAELRAEGGTSYPYVADLSSLGQVAELADQIARDHASVNVVVNNAGVGFGAEGGGRELSADGYELRLAVNYLAPVVLTRLLRAPLRAADQPQVLNVGSVGQSPLDFDDPQFTRGYQGAEAYMRSKFALAAFTFATAEDYRGDGIQVNCVHPGNYLDTGMTREAGIGAWTSVADGTKSVVHAVDTANQDRDRTGVFFNGTHPGRANRSAYDSKVQARLGELTRQLLSRVERAADAAW